MLGYIILAAVIGYFIGRREWKKIADDACEVAGKAILLAEQYKEQYDRD